MVYKANINKAVKKNFDFRKRMFEGSCMELDSISIPPNAALGEDLHKSADEILVIVKGKGKVIIDGRSKQVRRHDAIFITAGHRHNLRNTGRCYLKLFSVCSPPARKITTGLHRSGAKALKQQLQCAWEQ